MRSIFVLLLVLSCARTVFSQDSAFHTFRVVAFFTGREDAAHITFVEEANRWFHARAIESNFVFDTTSNWNNLNDSFLSNIDVVVFLDSRPELTDHRLALRRFVEKGGGWLGFHFAGFALKDSKYPDNWPWYHDEFIGAGQYKSNTWRPTAETLRVKSNHPSTTGLPTTFESAPNEWYRWELDLTRNSDIQIILALDESTFPVGTGPKQHEIWRSGFYPVAWTNRKFNMMYINMGHNDMDYGGTGKALSSTFSNAIQARFVLQTLLWLGSNKIH